MNWLEALKVFNKGKKWTIPKKGTPEYNKVKMIMDSGKKTTKTKKMKKGGGLEEVEGGELLGSADDVKMRMDDFIAEHEDLIKKLEMMGEEGKKQKMELKKVLKSKSKK
jgi:transposase